MHLLLGPIRSISGYYIWAVREKLARDTSESSISTNYTSTGPESHKESTSDPHDTKMTDTNKLRSWSGGSGSSGTRCGSGGR
jgi:hypothetical protein